MQTELTQSYVTYSAQTKLLELGVYIAEKRLQIRKPKVQEKFNQAVKIRLWLKALLYSDYLEQDTINKLVLCLAQLADVNAIPYAPVITTVDPPSIITGGSTTIINNYYSSGTTFINPDIDTGSEAADSFAVTSAYGAVWHYTLRSGSSQRSGVVVGSWLSSGASVSYSEESTEDIGSTSDVTLSVDFSGGNIRLVATAASNNWILEGTRFLING